MRILLQQGETGPALPPYNDRRIVHRAYDEEGRFLGYWNHGAIIPVDGDFDPDGHWQVVLCGSRTVYTLPYRAPDVASAWAFYERMRRDSVAVRS